MIRIRRRVLRTILISTLMLALVLPIALADGMGMYFHTNSVIFAQPAKGRHSAAASSRASSFVLVMVIPFFFLSAMRKGAPQRLSEQGQASV